MTHNSKKEEGYENQEYIEPRSRNRRVSLLW